MQGKWRKSGWRMKRLRKKCEEKVKFTETDCERLTNLSGCAIIKASDQGVNDTDPHVKIGVLNDGYEENLPRNDHRGRAVFFCIKWPQMV